MTDKLTPVDLSKFRVMLNGEAIRIANAFHRPIKGANVNITIDDGKLPEIDMLGSMHKFDTEKVTGDIAKSTMAFFNDALDEGSLVYEPSLLRDRIRDILEANLSDERNEAHVCKCNVKED